MVLAPEHPLVDALDADAWPERHPPRWTGGHATPPTPSPPTGARRAARPTSSARPRAGTRPASFTGVVRRQPGQRRADPDLRRRLRADGLRHRRDHGRARPGPARLGVRRAPSACRSSRTVQPPDGLRRARPTPGDGPAINSDALTWTAWASPRPSGAIIDVAGGERRRRGARSPTSCATGCSAASATGASRSRSSTTTTACRIALPDDDAARRAARGRRLLAARRSTPTTTTSEPEPPLAGPSEWVDVELDLGDGPKRYRRETNVMPQWAGSCWYELRYLDPTNENALRRPARSSATGWARRRPATSGGVDLYVGGVEHAVLHLLYARFWHKVLFDLGHVSSEEPFHRLFNQGYILADAFTGRARHLRRRRRGRASATARSPTSGEPVTRECGQDGQEPEERRSTPDDMYDEYGADTLRLYEMAMGPLDAVPAVGDPRRRRHVPLPAAAVAQRGRRGDRRRRAWPTAPADDETRRAAAPHDRRACAPTWTRCGSTPPSPG